jgi:hypothetical protein
VKSAFTKTYNAMAKTYKGDGRGKGVKGAATPVKKKKNNDEETFDFGKFNPDAIEEECSKKVVSDDDEEEEEKEVVKGP